MISTNIAGGNESSADGTHHLLTGASQHSLLTPDDVPPGQYRLTKYPPVQSMNSNLILTTLQNFTRVTSAMVVRLEITLWSGKNMKACARQANKNDEESDREHIGELLQLSPFLEGDVFYIFLLGDDQIIVLQDIRYNSCAMVPELNKLMYCKPSLSLICSIRVRVRLLGAIIPCVS